MSGSSDDDSILVLRSDVDGHSFDIGERELKKKLANEIEFKENLESILKFEPEIPTIIPLQKEDSKQDDSNSNKTTPTKYLPKFSSENSSKTINKDLKLQTNDLKSEDMESINIHSDENIFIKNIDTGEIYDLYREEEKIASITNEISFWKLEKGDAWTDFWKQIKSDLETIWDASEIGDLDVLKKVIELRKHQGNLNINSKLNAFKFRTLDDWTALHLATNEGHIEIIEFLIKNGANIEAETCMGRRPLHIAVLRGNEKVVATLLKHKASANSQDHSKNTPIHLASLYGHEANLQLLLESKPDLSKQNSKGLTAIQVSSNPKIISIFEKFGGSTEIFTQFGIGIRSQDSYKRGIQKKLSVEEQPQSQSIREISFELEDQMQSSGKLKTIGKVKKIDTLNKERGKDTNFFQRLFSSPLKMNGNIIRKAPSQPKPQITKITIDEGSGKGKLTADSFNFLKKLGQGSFGEVYLAELKSNSKLFAIKILRKEKVIHQNLIRYARTERNVLSLQSHPFIVKLNYAFQSRTKLFLVLDYCPNGDLGKFLNIHKKFSENITKIYIAELVLAIEILHDQHIIFRDLKPENVVIEENGHICLTDFGLSKQGISNNLSKSFCGFIYSLIRTMAYLAPEMIRRTGHGKSVDWYLLGVLMYELLAGSPPYYHPNKAKLFENILGGSLSYPKGISTEAKSILKGFLCRDPKLRLGAISDASEIKVHPWFSSIDWNDLLLKTCPMPVPPKKNLGILTPLEIDFDRDVETSEDQIIEKNNKKFENWTFIGSNEEIDLLDSKKKLSNEFFN